LFRRDDLTVGEVRPATPTTLEPGEIRLAVERFGLSSINITYAWLIDCPIPFLDVFPAPEGFGRVPTWGFAVVEESRHSDVAVGDRIYGYLPMSTHHTLAVESTPRGLVDVSPERGFLHPWYRGYRRAGAPDALDDRRALLWPLYPASFSLADFLAKQAAGGAKSVVVTSASSKTAIGMADLLARQEGLTTIGLTADRSTAFVGGLGLYDTVAAYDDLGSVDVTAPAVLVDFTGEPTRLTALYRRFAGDLCHTALVGYTHPGALVRHPQLTDPAPVIFFTPMVEDQAVAEEGADHFYARYHAAEAAFVESTASWLTMRHHQGPDAIADLYRSVLAGEQPPHIGNTASP
jgi:hypothetical protein